MTFDEYQKKALTTDSSAGEDTLSAQFFAIVLGFAGEAGEISEKFKKIYWHKNGAWDKEDKIALSKELGDMLWYVSSISSHIGVPLEKIAELNIKKLSDRVERGVHKGWGDDR